MIPHQLGEGGPFPSGWGRQSPSGIPSSLEVQPGSSAAASWRMRWDCLPWIAPRSHLLLPLGRWAPASRSSAELTPARAFSVQNVTLSAVPRPHQLASQPLHRIPQEKPQSVQSSPKAPRVPGRAHVTRCSESDLGNPPSPTFLYSSLLPHPRPTPPLHPGLGPGVPNSPPRASQKRIHYHGYPAATGSLWRPNSWTRGAAHVGGHRAGGHRPGSCAHTSSRAPSPFRFFFSF